jgi:hypothetical protein
MGSICDLSEILLELGLSGTVIEEERAICSVALNRAEGAIKKYLKYDPVQRTRTEYYPQHDFENEARTAVWETEGTQAILRRRADAANNELQLQHIPIRSVTTLAIDYDGRSGAKSGAFAASTEKTEGEDFWPNYDGNDGDGNSICRDGIIRSIGSWATTPGSVKVVYVAGYTNDELHGQGGVVDASPIVHAVISESIRRAKKAFLGRKSTSVGFTPGAVTSEKLGDYSVSYAGTGTSRLFSGDWNLSPETMNELEGYVNWGWVY